MPPAKVLQTKNVNVTYENYRAMKKPGRRGRESLDAELLPMAVIAGCRKCDLNN
jgi:hypothetical protein